MWGMILATLAGLCVAWVLLRFRGMWTRGVFYFTVWELLRALVETLWWSVVSPDAARAHAEASLAALWPAREQTFLSLSVRTSFDAYLQVLKLPAGSEVIFSGITIHDMTEIAR